MGSIMGRVRRDRLRRSHDFRIIIDWIAECFGPPSRGAFRDGTIGGVFIGSSRPFIDR